MSSEVLEELYLAQSSLGQDLLAEDIGDLLDSNTLAGLVVHGGTAKRIWHGQSICVRRAEQGVRSQQRSARLHVDNLPDDTIGALTKLFGDGVALVNDEVLIEDLEGLAPLKFRHVDCCCSLRWWYTDEGWQGGKDEV